MKLLTLLQQQALQLKGQIRSLLPLGQPALNPLPLKQYQRLLCANLAYHRALETALKQQAAFLPDYDHLRRCRTPYLVADLLASGAPIPQQYPSYFSAWSSWKLMGAAYVGEGLATEAEEVIEALQQSPLVPPVARISRFFNLSPTAERVATYVTHRAEGHEEEVITGVQEAMMLYADLTQDAALH